jgi:SAM-dependent methyltransferase
MKRTQSLLRLVGASSLAGFLALSPALGQPAADYQPTVGQQGKDVVWVPTAESLVARMLDTAAVTPNDYVIDLGSGDGRTVIAAAKRGAKALGIEYNPDMVELAIRNAVEAGVSDRARFIKADLFETDFSQATVLTLFLLPDINLRLRPKILDMKPGTRVVSNTFTMGEWTADQTITSPPECKSFCTAYFWIVPAKVEGQWRLEDGELTLKQQFQMVSGTMRSGNVVAPIANGKLKGDEITFSAGGREFKGRVNGDVIEGTSEAGESKATWRATRG